MCAQMPLHFHRSQAYERSLQTARTPSYLQSLAFVFVFRLLFPYGLSVDNALDRVFSARHVIYAKPNAVAIAEIELAQITVQVLLAAMLVHAFHTELEYREISLDRVRGSLLKLQRFIIDHADLAKNVFLLAVVHRFVAGKFVAKLFVS